MQTEEEWMEKGVDGRQREWGFREGGSRERERRGSLVSMYNK